MFSGAVRAFVYGAFGALGAACALGGLTVAVTAFGWRAVRREAQHLARTATAHVGSKFTINTDEMDKP